MSRLVNFICFHCSQPSQRYAIAHTKQCFSCAYEQRRRGHRAVAKVRAAILSGVLPPPKTLACADCDGAAREYDHRNYSRPLEVEPVCHSCNLKRGPAIWGTDADLACARRDGPSSEREGH